MGFPKKILFIDEDYKLSRELAASLNRDRYEISTTSSNTHGLYLMLNYAYDMIFLDFNMSELPGIEVLKKASSRISRLPIFLFTGKPSIVKLLSNAGLSKFAKSIIVKPVVVDKFISRIKSFCR